MREVVPLATKERGVLAVLLIGSRSRADASELFSDADVRRVVTDDFQGEWDVLRLNVRLIEDAPVAQFVVVDTVPQSQVEAMFEEAETMWVEPLVYAHARVLYDDSYGWWPELQRRAAAFEAAPLLPVLRESATKDLSAGSEFVLKVVSGLTKGDAHRLVVANNDLAVGIALALVKLHGGHQESQNSIVSGACAMVKEERLCALLREAVGLEPELSTLVQRGWAVLRLYDAAVDYLLTLTVPEERDLGHMRESQKRIELAMKMMSI